MEPLSAAVNILTVLQMAGKVVGYLNSVKNAPKERENVIKEISSITGVLFLVKDQADRESTTPSSLRSLSVPKGPLEQYQIALETLASKFSPVGALKKLGRVVTWPFDKGEINSILLSLERLKSYFILALQSDHFDLSKTTKSAIDKLSGAVEWLRLAQDGEECRRILDWLSTTDMEQKHQDIFSLHQENTCSWFSQSGEFTGWLENDQVDPLLWCPGDPGAGKTVMTSVAVEQVRVNFESEEVGVAFAYCHYNDPDANTSASIVASLTRQLALRGNRLHCKVDELYRKLTRGNKSTRPRPKELQSLLLALASSFDKTYVLVDGIDECEKRDRSMLLSTLKDLANLRGSRVRVFVTSRPHAQDIQQAFKSFARLDIVATKTDIEVFVRNQLENDGELLDLVGADEETPLQERIVSITASQASGMFLMAVLQMERIRVSDSVKEINDALVSMPTDLFDMYAESLERMAKQPVTRYERGLRVLAWVSRVKRPLLVGELLHALVVEEADEDKPPLRQLDKSGLVQPNVIVDVCAGLVAIDPNSKVVRLVHATAQEYFDQLDDGHFSLADESISRSCLTYLGLDEFAQGPSSSDKELERRLTEFPFLDYSARFWGWHLHKVGNNRLQTVVLALFENKARIMSINQVSHLSRFRFPDYSQLYPRQVNPLHIAAHYGLYEFAKSLVTSGSAADLEAKDSFGWTALHRAAENGHVIMVRFLLEKGCDANNAAQFGGTALHRAAKNGHVEVARLLLLVGAARTDAEDNYGGTPLHRAARHRCEALARLLLSQGADANQPYNFEATLQLMMENGTIMPQVVSDTFQFFAHWEAKDEAVLRIETELAARERLRGGTALHEAAGAGSSGIGLVRLLLEEGGAEIDALDNFGGTALHRAARNGHEAIISLLLDRGAFIDSGCHYGTLAKELISMTSKHINNGSFERWTPDEFNFDGMVGATALHEAATNGHERAVRLLLARGADPNLSGEYSYSALQGAARNGHANVVGVLLDGGADVDQSGQRSMDRIACTALHEAAENGHEAVAILLLKAGADANRERGLDDITPLCLATKGGHRGVVDLLLDWGAEVNWKSESTGYTALAVAAETGDAAMVQLLLDRESDQVTGVGARGTIHSILRKGDRGGESFTPLWLAAVNDHAEVAKLLLLHHGADPNWAGGNTFSPQTVLHAAIEAGSLATVDELLASGVDPNSKSRNSPILHEAIRAVSSAVYRFTGESRGNNRDEPKPAKEVEVACQKFEAIVHSLVQAGADVSSPGSGMETALHIASRGGHERIAALLLANWADINATDSVGDTPLSEAARYVHLSTLRLLLDAGARVDVGVSPLYGAACGGSEEVAQMLLDNGAEVSESSGIRPKVLVTAAGTGVESIVRTLLDAGEDIEAVEDGGTAMTRAASAGHESMIRLLVEHGAQLETPEMDTERTPVLLAAIGGHESATQLLLGMGARPDQADKETGLSILSWAAGQGMKTVVELLLDRGIGVDAEDSSGRTPVSWAAEHGHAAVVRLLLKKGANPEGSVQDGQLTPLSLAASRGYVTVVRLLADAGANVAGKGIKDESSPFMLAVKERRAEVIQELLRRNADARGESVGDSGRPSLLVWSPQGGEYEAAQALLGAGVGATRQHLSKALTLAVQTHHLYIVQLLLGKDISLDGMDSKPLVLTVQAGDEDVVKALLDAGVRSNIMAALHAALQLGLLATARALLSSLEGVHVGEEAEGRTLLGRAAEKGYEDIVRRLLELGADPDTKDSVSSRTALSYAAQEGHMRIVELLRKQMKGAAESSQLVKMLAPGLWHERVAKLLAEIGSTRDVREVCEGDGQLLAVASGLGYERVVRLLLDKGIDPNLETNGKPPIYNATTRGKLPVVRLLLERGADPDVRSGDSGQSALSLAAEFSHDSIVRLLLETEADVESRDSKDGSTPLHWAAKKGCQGAARLLLKNGAQTDSLTNDGQTPLLVAARHGNGAVAKLLLDHGADIRYSGEDRQTALHLAAAAGFIALSGALLERCCGNDDIVRLEDKDGKTPLDLARANNYKTLAKLLEAHLSRGSNGMSTSSN